LLAVDSETSCLINSERCEHPTFDGAPTWTPDSQRVRGDLRPSPPRYNVVVIDRTDSDSTETGTLALGSSAEAERLQVERWRAMPPQEKAHLVSALTRAVQELSRPASTNAIPTHQSMKACCDSPSSSWDAD